MAEVTAGEYLGRMVEGWRHFGTMLFRPACTGCKACRTLRVPVDHFRPNRSQQRNRKDERGRPSSCASANPR